MKKPKLKLILCILLSLMLTSCGNVSSKGNMGERKCTVSVSCGTLLDNNELLAEEKQKLIPENGFVIEETEVYFSEGDSVFDILLDVCRENKIHMEYSDVPLYNSAYIEGINNIYEFDAGSLSGWMYSVNDYFPNYGCSQYLPEDGDVIKWLYTCDLGDDIGGGNFYTED